MAAGLDTLTRGFDALSAAQRTIRQLLSLPREEGAANPSTAVALARRVDSQARSAARLLGERNLFDLDVNVGWRELRGHVGTDPLPDTWIAAARAVKQELELATPDSVALSARALEEVRRSPAWHDAAQLRTELARARDIPARTMAGREVRRARELALLRSPAIRELAPALPTSWERGTAAWTLDSFARVGRGAGEDVIQAVTRHVLAGSWKDDASRLAAARRVAEQRPHPEATRRDAAELSALLGSGMIDTGALTVARAILAPRVASTARLSDEAWARLAPMLVVSSPRFAGLRELGLPTTLVGSVPAPVAFAGNPAFYGATRDRYVTTWRAMLDGVEADPSALRSAAASWRNSVAAGTPDPDALRRVLLHGIDLPAARSGTWPARDGSVPALEIRAALDGLQGTGTEHASAAVDVVERRASLSDEAAKTGIRRVRELFGTGDPVPAAQLEEALRLVFDDGIGARAQLPLPPRGLAPARALTTEQGVQWRSLVRAHLDQRSADERLAELRALVGRPLQDATARSRARAMLVTMDDAAAPAALGAASRRSIANLLSDRHARALQPALTELATVRLREALDPASAQSHQRVRQLLGEHVPTSRSALRTWLQAARTTLDRPDVGAALGEDAQRQLLGTVRRNLRVIDGVDYGSGYENFPEYGEIGQVRSILSILGAQPSSASSPGGFVL